MNAASYAALNRITAELLRVEMPDPIPLAGDERTTRNTQTNLSANSGGRAGGWHRYMTMTTGHVAARLLRHSHISQLSRRLYLAIGAWKRNRIQAACEEQMAAARLRAATADAPYPFGTPGAARRICDILAAVPLAGLPNKGFHDLPVGQIA